jgi:hypothetical protein
MVDTYSLTSAPFIVCDKPGQAGSPTVLLYATYGTADDDEVRTIVYTAIHCYTCITCTIL